MFLEVLLKVCGVFLLVLFGVVGGKIKIVTKETLPAINGLIFNIAIPCLMFSCMQVDDISRDNFNTLFGAFLAFAVVTIALSILSFPIMKHVKMDERQKGLYRTQIAFTNSGFMAIPLVSAIFGKEVLFPIVMMCALFSIMMYSFGLIVLNHEKGDPFFDKSMLKQIVNAPIISACVSALFFVFHIHIPDFLMFGVDLMADAVSPLAMFVVGVNLSYSSIKKIVQPGKLAFCALSLLAVPLITLGICLALPINNVALVAVTFAMAMPSPSIVPVLANRYGKDAVLAAEGVASTTFFSLITVPVWGWLLLSFF